MAIIEIEHLSKVYGSGDGAVTALTDVSLAIERGEIFGVIGLSGAGKSTLVRCINMLERPTEGAVRVDGQEMTGLTPYELRAARRSIGMIFQGFNLMMQRTALENIIFPLRIAGSPKADAIKRGRELLATVGLSDREGAYPSQLSGGQKQRVAIARALAADPKVLLCDEATSALDPTTTQSILELLRELNRSLGLTIVVITHEMKVIEQICSRVAIIDDSRIKELGRVEDVFVRPKTAAARRLVLPQNAVEHFGGGRRLRIVFDGASTDRPILSNMVLQCAAPVNILFADTKDIDGRVFGHMIVQLPDDEHTAQRMLAFLEREHVAYVEEQDEQ